MLYHVVYYVGSRTGYLALLMQNLSRTATATISLRRA